MPLCAKLDNSLEKISYVTNAQMNLITAEFALLNSQLKEMCSCARLVLKVSILPMIKCHACLANHGSSRKQMEPV